MDVLSLVKRQSTVAQEAQDPEPIFLQTDHHRIFFILPENKSNQTVVVQMHIGVRPLIESKKSMVKTSREYQLDLHDFGQTQLLHVFGGKLTTHWSLAEKSVHILGLL